MITVEGTSSTHQLTNEAQRRALDALVQARAAGSSGALRAAEHQVLNTHLELATALSRRYRGRGIDAEDLLQLARLGLVKAVKRWAPELGTDFIPFAYPTILGEIKRYFRDHSTMIRMPRGLLELHQQTSFAADELQHRLGRPATEEDLAAAVGVSAASVRQERAATRAIRAASLDVEAVARVADQLPTDNWELELGRVEDAVMLGQAVAELSDRDRHVLQMRFFQDMSQARIAEVVGLSQMQVSRILRQILIRLRAVLAEDVAEPDATPRLAG